MLQGSSSNYFPLFLCAFALNFVGIFGRSPYSIGPKIINGTVADPEKIKYQVLIHLKEREWYFGLGHICGGSLIKPSIVLSAAHCAYNADLNASRTPNEFIVAMGSMDRYDRFNNMAFEVFEIYIKDTFESSTMVDDIAIFILNGFVPENSKTIKPIEINWKEAPAGMLCLVSGWGMDENGFVTDALMDLNVPILNRSLCIEKYKENFGEGMICAGFMNGSADSCAGDSGGPLVCDEKLTGIVSFGIGCAIPDYPGIYTDIKYHEKWIRNITNKFDNHNVYVISKGSNRFLNFKYLLFIIAIKLLFS